jgi:hypothetical protein
MTNCAQRRALRLYSEAEKRSVPEQIRREARAEARKLLASGKVYGRSAEALRLYTGLDDGKWRSHGEVGGLMNLSAERVRQLLAPSKRSLIARLFDRVPCRTLKDHESNGNAKIEMVIASLIAPDEDWSPIFKILSSIKGRRSEADRLSARWVKEEAQWVVTLPGA